MQLETFRAAFWKHFQGAARNEPDETLWDPAVAAARDLCPDVEGKLSLRKQQLLNLGFSLLSPGEAYLEIGTYHGKSLLSAMLHNPERPVYAVDNFSEFAMGASGNSLNKTLAHLAHYGLRDKVVFYDADFRTVCTPDHLKHPIGMYFYDGAHDEASQYDGIRLVEPFLADEALVLVDDWRLAQDSGSYAKAGTLRAIAESPYHWALLYELPARKNGDLGLWWNGVGVLWFRRMLRSELQEPESDAG